MGSKFVVATVTAAGSPSHCIYRGRWISPPAKHLRDDTCCIYTFNIPQRSCLRIWLVRLKYDGCDIEWLGLYWIFNLPCRLQLTWRTLRSDQWRWSRSVCWVSRSAVKHDTLGDFLKFNSKLFVFLQKKRTKVETVTRISFFSDPSILRMTVYSRAVLTPLKYPVASWENSCVLSASVKLTCSLSFYTNY